MEVSGDMFIFHQGDDVDLEWLVKRGGVPFDLTGGSAVLSYKKLNSSDTAIKKECTIETTFAIASFAHADTKAASFCGMYKFHLRCKDANDKEVMTKKGKINVLETIDPNSLDVPEP